MACRHTRSVPRSCVAALDTRYTKTLWYFGGITLLLWLVIAGGLMDSTLLSPTTFETVLSMATCALGVTMGLWLARVGLRDMAQKEGS